MWLPTLDAFVRLLLVTPVAYAAAVIALRLSGPRSLAKLNAFDLVVTVALGSVLASIITSADLALANGVLGIVLLLLLQIGLSRWTASHTEHDDLVRSRPTLLVRHGVLLEDAVAAARLTPAEVRQAVRSSGEGSIGDVAAVCLESDGTISVIGSSSLGDASALTDVPGWSDENDGSDRPGPHA